MKKSLIIGLIAFTLLALAACNGSSNGNAGAAAVMDNLAGAWDLSAAGILVSIQTDGTWETSWGDISYRGKVELTQDSGDYIAEFIILEQSGPGAMYDSYGNIREEAFNAETNEFYWIPFPDEYSLWLFGTYFVDYDRLVIASIWGNDFDFEQEMERVRELL